MEIPPSVIVSVITVLIGVIVNVALVASMFTRMGEAIKRLSDAVDKLSERMDGIDSRGNTSSLDAAKISVRLEQVEHNTTDLNGLRAELAGTHATAAAERRDLKTCYERLERRLENVTAQMSHVLQGRANKALEIGG